MMDTGNTIKFQSVKEEEDNVSQILHFVYEALKEKGHDPVNQIVGYIMSGDPTFITSYKNARNLITKVNRDELVEELLVQFINNKK
ncbi:MAG: IreB family regulatory phosphoprotein [Lachnospiraceae bacterium]|nr:IreB family regulatory phosphoprotein [Lachnospiraceae bacterium]